MNFAALVRSLFEEMGPYEAAAVAGVWLRLAVRPDAGDLARGCDPDQLGAFFGAAREIGRPGEPLPDCRPAEGEIVLYLGNIRPLNASTITTVLRHELLHARGYEEEEIHDMGLGALGECVCS